MDLLGRSLFPQAAVLLQSRAPDTDLSLTQYSVALDWLGERELLVKTATGPCLSRHAQGMPGTMVDELLFAACLELEQPLWLPDADVLVTDTDVLPEETRELAGSLGLDEGTALRVIRQVHGKVDLAERSARRTAGRVRTCRPLDVAMAGCAHHLSLSDDGLGYDVLCELGPDLWHLEVKTTTRKGRLRIFFPSPAPAPAIPTGRLIVVDLTARKRSPSRRSRMM